MRSMMMFALPAVLCGTSFQTAEADMLIADRSREIVLDEKYLLFPVNNAAKPCRMKLTIAGRAVQDFDINLAAAGVDWWAKLDMSRYAGKTAPRKDAGKAIDAIQLSAGGWAKIGTLKVYPMQSIWRK